MNEKEEYLRLLEEKHKRKIAERIDCSKMTRLEANAVYDEIIEADNWAAQRRLCQIDLFFLLTRACRRKDIDHDWLYARCREVEANPNGYLDLWAREHYKSTIITFGLSIKDILSNPDHSLIGIFSHTRSIAKGFLNQIKRELESNQLLKDLFPDILYQNPQVEASQWSLDGLIVKRKTNPKESTVEAWGVVDSQPTSKHFTILVYDDLVTRESVSTPEQIKKTTESLELSYNLGAKGGVRRFIGTRYHSADTYKTIIDRGTVIPRIKPATDNGLVDGEPVFLDRESLNEKRRDQGPYTFSAQMLQNPTADNSQGFKVEWLKYYKTLRDTSKWNKYLLIDGASQKKKTSDYTVMWVWGLAPDANLYLLDAVRDRMNLTARQKKLFEFHRKWKPRIVGYERYGKDSDIEHMEYAMEQENYRFPITEVGGAMPKEDRIKRLVPTFEQGRIWLPERLHFVDYEGKAQDFVQLFIENEFKTFPVSTHDDMLDCASRIFDIDYSFPKESSEKPIDSSYGIDLGWMG